MPNAAIYDAKANAWTVAGSTAVGHVKHTATRMANGLVVVSGGASASIGPAIATTEIFDPSTNRWTTGADLLMGPRVGHTATLLSDGTVLAAGGKSADTHTYTPFSEAGIFALLPGTP